MRVSNDVGLTGATWEPYAATKEWRLGGDPSGLSCVYVEFRDAAQNVSRLANDCIRMPRRVYLPVILRNQSP